MLLERGCAEGLTLGQIEQELKGRGFPVLLILLVLPFCLPVSIPGFSVPFGIAVMLVGIRMAAGKHPWLPGFLLRRKISGLMLHKILDRGVRLALRLERFVKPRMHFLDRWPLLLRLSGALIALNGFYLALPWPPAVILTNTIPALAVLFLTFGRMEKDGVFTLLGYAMTLLATAYFVAIALFGGAAIHYLIERFGG